ncbi:unnamed protein product [Mesocestoides corti]|uniref:Uncharacterized protein n=1 Tax=Mesocestoides corti TaxID=53468 RepID=A0A0R3U864_MESCO|nr:unnamed protein product [Mesocestoides corti]
MNSTNSTHEDFTRQQNFHVPTLDHPVGVVHGGRVVYQHVGKLVRPPETSSAATSQPRFSIEDGPFVAVVSIGSLFVALTVVLVAVSFVFLRRQSRKEVARQPSGMIVTHSGTARHLEEASVMEWKYSLTSSTSGDFDELSDVSEVVDLDDTPPHTLGRVFANPHLCPRHSQMLHIHSASFV